MPADGKRYHSHPHHPHFSTVQGLTVLSSPVLRLGEALPAASEEIREKQADQPLQSENLPRRGQTSGAFKSSVKTQAVFIYVA